MSNGLEEGRKMQKVIFKIEISLLSFEEYGISIDVEDCPYMEFYVYIGGRLGYLQFIKREVTGSEYIANQVLQVRSEVPSPLALVQRVLWTRKAAREADRKEAAFGLLKERKS